MKKILFLSLLAILIPIVIFGFVGCMKKPDMTPNYGPEVGLDKIQEAISSDAPMDPFSMKKGQYVSIDETQVIDTQVPNTLSQRLDQITDYQDLPSQVNLTFKVNLKEFVNGSWKESTQTYPPLTLTKNSGMPAPALLAIGPRIARTETVPLSIQALRVKDAATPAKVTYHNLKRELGTMPVPDVVKAHPNCGGVLRCDLGLRFLKVSFDRVVWDAPDHGIKTTYRIIYSQDIPVYIHDWDVAGDYYLTNQFQTCAQIFIEVQNGNQKQTVPILQCAELRDFQFGL